MPRSLHCGWVTAASLVNLNAYVGKAAFGPNIALAVAGMSLFAGALLAEAYTRSGLPVAACAIAWALFSVSKGLPVGADAEVVGQANLDKLAVSAAVASGFVLVSVATKIAARSKDTESV